MELYGIKLALPSRGLYGKAFVNVRKPKVGDLLSYFESENSLSAKNAFINSLCDTDLSSYPVGDREFIFVSLRSLVNTGNITGVINCKSCPKQLVYIMNLSSCNVNMLPDDFVKDYEYTFPVSGIKKCLNVLTVEKEILLDEYVRYYSEDLPLPNKDLGENLKDFARYGCLFNDSTTINSLDENVSFLRDLDWDDFKWIIMYDLSFSIGPEVYTEVKCDSCGQRHKINIRTDSAFYGIGLENLISKHRFLAKASNIGFNDFLSYSIKTLENVAEQELQRVKDHNARVRQNIKK